MTAIDNTNILLYRYLRSLSAKVSRSTVHRLLDTPVGSSMRGISDALDALHIKNEVYQLPPSSDYFAQVETPFITMLQQRMADLLNPKVFQSLLPLEAHIEKPIAKNVALTNQAGNCDHLMVVTNPNCGNCAKIHPLIEELSSTVPMSMILLTFRNDSLGKQVAQTIITVYLAEGWQKAMALLTEWHRDKRISEADKYPPTPEAGRIWREQQEYFLQQGIDKTPVSIAKEYYIPKVYKFSELRYVMT